MIQKVTPKKFVSDKDERLVAPNEMILAQNVTISERADGSASVLKTMKGTDKIERTTTEFQSIDPFASTWKVVGTVSDEQRGRVYAFVYDTADATDHRILMVSTDPDDFPSDTNRWRTVFKSDYLNFNEDYPVKGDLINKAFGQDGVVQTALYFTDNNNPPRKINVDRALNGDYKPVDTADLDGNPLTYQDIDLDYALLTMRGTPMSVPTFSFSNDPDQKTNNFKNDTFQFSCQFIYKDGEESALGPYSRLAVPPAVSAKSLSEAVGQTLDGNVCIIRLPWDPQNDSEKYYDVKSIRLLARSGNSNPFFVVDEFDPNQDVFRDIGESVSKQIYDATTGDYRFYNDSYYGNIADSVSTKLYDNVPLKAEGQSIAASRLLYSNYTEGYPNFDISPSVSLDVQYSDSAAFEAEYVTNSSGVIRNPDAAAYVPATYTESGQTYDAHEYAKRMGEFRVNLKDGVDFDWPGSAANNGLDAELPAGTKFSLSWKWNTQGNWYHPTNGDNDEYLYAVRYTQGDAAIKFVFGKNISGHEAKIPSDAEDVNFSFSYTSGAGDTVQDIYDKLKDYINNRSRKITYSQNSTGWLVAEQTDWNTSDNYSLNQVLSLGGMSGEAIWKFAAIDSEEAGVIRVVPYMRYFQFSAGQSVPWGSLALPSGGSYTVQFLTTIQSHPSTSGTLGIGSFTKRRAAQNQPTSNGSNISVEAQGIAEGTFGFKHGSSHDFGIVYYDKWGRSSFVNRVGSTYVKHPAERSDADDTSDKGPATVKVTINNSQDSDIPSWAESYQMVYGGSQYSSVFSYVTGGAYMVMTNDDSSYDENGGAAAQNVLQVDDKRIFVSLNSLAQFQDISGSARDYSFTKGDICRVVSYIGTSGDREYPRANDGSIIEFEVVGVETLSRSNTGYIATAEGNLVGDSQGNPIQWDTPTSQTRGKFLVLKAPRVDGNAQVTPTGGGASQGLKYIGWDWFSIARYWAGTSSLTLGGSNPGSIDYPDTTAATQANYWGRESVIEILTPKKISDTPVFYEIGDRIPLDGELLAPPIAHGSPFKLSEGDVHLRSVSCRGPKNVGGSWNIGSPSSWKDASIVLENQSPSESETENFWSKGKAHTTFENAATINRYNSITYSEPYADDTNRLSLSSFVPSQVNFFDLPSEYGRCSFLGLSSDQLMAIQENKVSRLGVNKDVLETGTQSGVVTISSKLINNLVSYAGDFGTGNPESVLIRDGITYFVDAERRAVVRLSSKGLEVISDKDISSTVEAKITEWSGAEGKTIVSGYDPEDNNYFVTLSPQGAFDGYTLGYHEKGGFWQGNYTFYADRYASIKDRFFGLKATESGTSGDNTIFYEFKDLATSNSFFGQNGSSQSKVRVVFNLNPSMVKTFKALSIEGKVDWNVRVFNEDGREALVGDSSEREGAFYRNIDGILSNSTSQFLPIGTVSSSNNSGTVQTVVTFDNNLKGMHIPKGYEVYSAGGNGAMTKLTANAANDPGETPLVHSVDRSSSKVTFRPQIDLTPNDAVESIPEEGDRLFVASPVNGLNSDRVRGKYAIVEVSYSPLVLTAADILEGLSDLVASGQEIFAINAHFANSPLNDAIGKQ